MKKKVLFIIPSLNAGGAEKSLVNLLNHFDYEKYEVDLFIFCRGGIFEQFLPKDINIIEYNKDYINFSLGLKSALINFIKDRKGTLIINRLLFSMTNKIRKDKRNIDQYNWKFLSKSLKSIDKKYDVAIGFLEKTSIYFCIDKVNANKKIGFIHNDYRELGLNPKIDEKYFEKLDNIFTVSENCLNILKDEFQNEKDKFGIMRNVVSVSMINKMATTNESVYKKDKEQILISIGRLHEQKGFDIAIETCKKLIDKGYDIKWYVIGEGEEREALKKLIAKNNLEDKFILLGIKSNPYPFIKQADIYVQPSRYEGKSIALDEAKILKKPIIITNYTTAKDQIENGKNGLIVETNANSLEEGIEILINHKSIRYKFIKNLSLSNFGTESEIKKLYEIIEKEGN
ncbi:Glycosyl transferase group 1 [human gut metagenome]|uniref:Glycosyl transferase group 1 n=1 Tax=human gut metagenome TaxID=408170 RepID=W1WT07_9ZZZZ